MSGDLKKKQTRKLFEIISKQNTFHIQFIPKPFFFTRQDFVPDHDALSIVYKTVSIVSNVDQLPFYFGTNTSADLIQSTNYTYCLDTVDHADHFPFEIFHE